MNVMGLAEIMDMSVEDLKKYFKTIILFYLCYGITTFFAVIILIIAGALLTVVFVKLFENLILSTVIISLFIFMAVTIYAAANMGMIKIASQEFTGEKIFAFEAITESFKNIFKTFRILVVSLIVFLPVLAAIAATGYFFLKSYEHILKLYSGNKASIVLLLVFTVLLAIAAIFLTLSYLTFLSFSFHAAVLEKKGVISSLKRSYFLVKHDFWRIFGSLILFGLTVYAINYSIESLAGVVIGLIYLILKFLNTAPNFISFFTDSLTYISYPMSLLAWMVIAPIGVIMSTLLYFNQRFKLEGYDLSLRLKNIQKYNERLLENHAAK